MSWTSKRKSRSLLNYSSSLKRKSIRVCRRSSNNNRTIETSVKATARKTTNRKLTGRCRPSVRKARIHMPRTSWWTRQRSNSSDFWRSRGSSSTCSSPNISRSCTQRSTRRRTLTIKLMRNSTLLQPTEAQENISHSRAPMRKLKSRPFTQDLNQIGITQEQLVNSPSRLRNNGKTHWQTATPKEWLTRRSLSGWMIACRWKSTISSKKGCASTSQSTRLQEWSRTMWTQNSARKSEPSRKPWSSQLCSYPFFCKTC